MRVALLLLSVALAAVGLWLWLGESKTPEAVLPSATTERDHAAKGPGLKGADAGARAAHAAREAAKKKAAQARGSASGATGEAGGDAVPMKTLRGTVVLRDESGAKVPKLSATLEVSWWHESTETTKRIDVRDGAWSFQLPRGASLEIGLLQWGDRFGFIRWEGEAVSDLEKALELEARLVPPSILHVLDHESGAPLENVRLVSDWTFMDVEHPTLALDDPEIESEGVRTMTGRSPIRIEPRGPDEINAAETFWLTAPGYAWSSIELDTMSGGERTIRLVPGGGVRVNFRGAEPANNMVVRILRAGGGEELVERELSSHEAMQFGGVPVGLHRVVIQRGNTWEEPEEFATADCLVEPGGLATITLQIPEVQPERRVPWAGEFFIPPAWGSEIPWPDFRFIDGRRDGGTPSFSAGRGGTEKLEPVKDAPGHYRFDFGLRHPGRYLMRLGKIGFAGVVTLPDAGTRRARLRVPEPGTLQVRVVLRGTNKPAPLTFLKWRMMPRGHDGGYRWRVATPKDVGGLFRIEVPAGVIRFDVEDEYSFAGEAAPEVRAGETKHVTIEVERAGILRIRFEEAGTRVPYSWDWDVDAKQIDGDGEAYLWSDDEGAQTIHVTRPGRYRVKVDDIPGYERLAPREVDVPADGEPEIVFRLVPKK